MDAKREYKRFEVVVGTDATPIEVVDQIKQSLREIAFDNGEAQAIIFFGRIRSLDDALLDRVPCALDNCGHMRQLDAIVDLLGMERGTRSVIDELRARGIGRVSARAQYSRMRTDVPDPAIPSDRTTSEQRTIAAVGVRALSDEDLLVALRNVGCYLDDCDACAEVFFTGSKVHDHTCVFDKKEAT